MLSGRCAAGFRSRFDATWQDLHSGCRGAPNVNITHATLHLASSAVRVLPGAPTYRRCEARWQSLWWGWGVLDRLLQCSAAWRRKAQRRQSPSCAADTYLWMTETVWTQGHKDKLQPVASLWPHCSVMCIYFPAAGSSVWLHKCKRFCQTGPDN